MPRRPAHLDMLLRVRQVQQDLRAHAFAGVQREIAAARHQRNQIERERKGLLDDAAKRTREHFDPRQMRSFYQYERHLARLIDDADSEIRRLCSVAEERRAELEEAMKNRRMIEKLRQRKINAFLTELQKDEQKLSDEKATAGAAVERAGKRARA